LVIGTSAITILIQITVTPIIVRLITRTLVISVGLMIRPIGNRNLYGCRIARSARRMMTNDHFLLRLRRIVRISVVAIVSVVSVVVILRLRTCTLCVSVR
jgi:hypothetical protein